MSILDSQGRLLSNTINTYYPVIATSNYPPELDFEIIYTKTIQKIYNVATARQQNTIITTLKASIVPREAIQNLETGTLNVPKVTPTPLQPQDEHQN